MSAPMLRPAATVLNLRDLDATALQTALAPFGVDTATALRIFARAHAAGAPSLTNVRGLSAAKAAAVAAATSWPELDVVERRRADDGFVKYLFRTADGHPIEAVRIPLPDAADARALKRRRREGRAAPLEALPTAKYTVCVSSQAGCALACGFCATGRLGAIRSLKTWEILAQVRAVAAEADRPVRGVVFMGMGEPLLNYENVLRAARVLSHPAGFAIAARAISISTAGVVPAIRRFTAETQPYRLIVSLGSPDPAERARLMPIEGRWPLVELVAAIRDHAAATGDRQTVAYVAIGGPDGNLTPDHAHRIADLFAGVRIKLNLIDVTDDAGGYRPPDDAERRAFCDALAARGVPFSRRYSGGREIGAACGTLSASRAGGVLVALRPPADPVLTRTPRRETLPG